MQNMGQMLNFSASILLLPLTLSTLLKAPMQFSDGDFLFLAR